MSDQIFRNFRTRGIPVPTTALAARTQFNYTGSYQSYLVPPGAKWIYIVAWGAAGAGYSAYANSSGGGAACIKGYITVTPGETLTIVVGKGGVEFGSTGTDAQGGGGGARAPGGGRSAIQRTRGVDIVTIAGGGGGGGNGDTGGSGGITAGGSGGSGAGGGTQTAGGVGDNNDGAYTTARNGIQFFGGTSSSGGGGGGWYGGGAGSWGPGYGSGGGGSSYIANMISYGLLTYPGSGRFAGNRTDSLYISRIGEGNSIDSGGNGLVYITPFTDVNFVENPAAATTITTPGSNIYTVPATTAGNTVTGVNLYILGSGGQNGHDFGGGGGFVSGFYACSPGTNLLYVVGTIGYNQNVVYGGGGGTNNVDNTSAGGFSGVFLSNAGGIVQSNAIAIAGGGGAGGYFGSGNGGGGGYPTGAQGTEGNAYGVISGGSQTAGGVGGASGSALIGGRGVGQSGGGGWFGGGSGFSYSADGNFPERPAGCGGSSYIGNVNGATGGIGLTAKAYYEQGYTLGVNNNDAGAGNRYYSSTVNHINRYVAANTGFVVFVPTYNPTPAIPVPHLPASTIITSATCNIYTVPSSVNSKATVGIYVYIWGGAGGYGNQPNGIGGSGGFVSGFYACAPSTVLTYVLGASGLPGWGNGRGTILSGGGSGTGGGEVAGGGFSAIFNCTTTAAAAQNNVIVVAGAGGSSGQYSYGNGGGGGYPTGGSATNVQEGGTNFATGGTQISPGTGSLSNGLGMIGGAGGGGGYFGGGGTTRGAGGGGSTYFGGLTSYVYYENGSNATGAGHVFSGTLFPGGITNPYYGGNAGACTTTSYNNGRIVILPAYNP